MKQLMVFVALLQLALLIDIAASAVIVISTRYPSNQVPAAVIWDGNEIVNVTIAGNNWDLTKIDGAFASTIFEESGGPTPNGPDALESLIFPSADTSYVVFQSATLVSLRLGAAPGFALAGDVQWAVNFNTAAQQAYLTNPADPPTGASITLRGNTNGGLAAFSTNATNEFAIRSAGMRIQARLRYNVFASTTSNFPTVTSATPELSTGWVFSFPDSYTVVAVLPPQPAFNLVKGSTALVTFDLSTTLLRVSGLGQPTPTSTPFTITSVDDTPVAYCLLTTARFSESQLRAGAVNTTIYLSPAPAVSFERFLLGSTIVGGQSVQQLWNNAITGVPRIAVAVDIREEFVVLTLTAPSDFDTDSELQISINPSKEVLRSTEAGCGILAITIVASSGQLVGRDVRSVTEVTVNDGDVVMNFDLLFDIFRPNSVDVDLIVTQIITDPLKVSGQTRGTDQALVGRTAFNVSSDGRAITVRIPRSPLYNIPEGMVEQVTVGFKANSTIGGVAPTPINATFNISGVVPRLSVALNSTGGTQVPVELLWSGLTIIRVRIDGDIWDPEGRTRWNVYHPSFDGAFRNTNYSFSAFHTTVSPAVRYGDVILNVHEAYLPVNAMQGLSLQFDERVFVSEVRPMLEGPKDTIIDRAVLQVMKVSPNNIFVTFGGHAARGATISETTIRAGLSFTIAVQNEGLSRERILASIATLFPAPRSLGPHLSLFNVTMVSAVPGLSIFYNATFTLPPIQSFDIAQSEVIEIVVPATWYTFTAPTLAAKSVLRIESEPSPDCILRNFPSGGITEGTVRSRDTLINVEVTERLDPDLFNKLQNGTVNFTYTSLHQGSNPLTIDLTEVGVFSISGLDKLVFTLRQNASYEINSQDFVQIQFDRRFFVDGETCNSNINFTIGALPGVVTMFPPAVVNESNIRAQRISITIIVRDDNVRVSAFNVSVSYDVEGGSVNGTSMRHLLNPSVILAQRQNATHFLAQLPRLPRYDIFSLERVRLSVPTEIFDSGKAPSVSGNVFTIWPSPGTVTATFNASISETQVAQGGQSIVLRLQNEEWDPARVLTELQAATIRSIAQIADADSETKQGLGRVFALSAFSLDDNRTVRVSMLSDFRFDSVVDMRVAIVVPANLTISGLIPIPNTFTITITARPGRLIGSGSAVLAGSRDLVLGGLQYVLTIENDLFVKRDLSPRELCPMPINSPNLQQLDCTLFVSDPDADFARVVILLFPNRTDFVIDRNTSYNIHIPISSIKSGRGVNNVSMSVYVQSGVLEPIPQLAGREFNEDVFRLGGIATIELRVGGDKFVQQPEVIVSSFARSLRCVPPSDNFGFCSRAVHIMTSGRYTYGLNNRRFVITLQPDPDFDIALDQTVFIDLGGLAMSSGLAPFSPTQQSFRVRPSVGEYFFSASTTSVVSQEVSLGFVDEPTKSITIILTLFGERWKSNPSKDLIEGFSSTSPLQREANGFMRWRSELFHGARVSDNGRVLTLQMRPAPDYVILQAESIIFSVSGQAVLSGVTPTQTSQSNRILVEATTQLEILSPRTFSATTLVQRGINVTLRLSGSSEWEPVSGRMFSSAIVSQSPPGLEPNGFEALRSRDAVTFTMPSDRSAFNVLQCTIAIPAGAAVASGGGSGASASEYYLRRKEVLRVTVPSQWIVSRLAPYPRFIDIAIDPALKTVVLITRNPVNRDALVIQLAKLLGVSTDTIVLESVERYGDVNDLYSRVRVSLLESTTPGARQVDDTISFLLNADARLTDECCRVMHSYLASSPPSDREINEKIGLSTAEATVERDDSLTWVWVMLGLLFVAAVGGAVYYWRHIKDAQYSGMNRALPADAETFTAKLILTSDPALTQGAGKFKVLRKDGNSIRGADFAATINQSASLRQLNQAEDEDELGLPSFAGRGKSTTRIDVDEAMQVGQPMSVFDQRIYKLDLPPPPPPGEPLKPDDTVSIYPPAMPHKAKFVPARRARVDTMML